MEIKNVAVIGGGTMGNGIAQVFASKGFFVSVCDLSERVLEKAKVRIEANLLRMAKKELIKVEDVLVFMENISFTTSLEQSVQNANLIIEAATESPEIKFKLFSEIDKLASSSSILATNTSSISITKIAACTTRPEHVIGMHFMNPVPVMKLVEVIRGYETSSEVCQTIKTVCEKLDKIPVEVNDFPGFVANRILMPMINEAIYSLHEGVGGVYEIDTVLKLGMAHPMGPLELADFIGLDVCLSILYVLHNGFGNPKYAPCPLLVNMVNAGRLGRKSGEGFYTYKEGTREMLISSKFL